jgi:hypothetical protein
MSAQRNRFYAVTYPSEIGITIGIYTTVIEASRNVRLNPGSFYKAFPSNSEATDWLHHHSGVLPDQDEKDHPARNLEIPPSVVSASATDPVGRVVEHGRTIAVDQESEFAPTPSATFGNNIRYIDLTKD